MTSSGGMTAHCSEEGKVSNARESAKAIQFRCVGWKWEEAVSKTDWDSLCGKMKAYLIIAHALTLSVF